MADAKRVRKKVTGKYIKSRRLEVVNKSTSHFSPIPVSRTISLLSRKEAQLLLVSLSTFSSIIPPYIMFSKPYRRESIFIPGLLGFG